MCKYPPWSIMPHQPTRPSGSVGPVRGVGPFRGIVLGVRVICCLWDVCDIVLLCSRRLGFFPPCFCGLFGFSPGRCVPGLAVGIALTGFIYGMRECWLVFISVNSCVLANLAAVRCRIHSGFCLEGMVCIVDVSMLWRRKWSWCASRVCRLD